MILFLNKYNNNWNTISIKGTSTTILLFWKWVCQITHDKLSSFELRYLLSDCWSGSFKQEINKTDKDKEYMELFFAVAWACDQNGWLASKGTSVFDKTGFQSKIFSNYQTSYHKNSNYSSYRKPHLVTNLNAQPMDLDTIGLANTECYKCHKKGHLTQHCKSDIQKTQNNHNNRKPNLLIMELDVFPVNEGNGSENCFETQKEI